MPNETPNAPNPGSADARAQRCLCPVVDNGYGRGAYVAEDGTAQFWITQGCPLHAPTGEVPV